MFSDVLERVEAADDAPPLVELREIEGERRELEARTAVVLSELDRRTAYRRDDHATMYGLLRSSLQWSDGECRQHMQIARLVDESPDVGEGLYEHWTSVANVAAIARVRANPRIGGQIDEVIGRWSRLASAAGDGGDDGDGDAVGDLRLETVEVPHVVVVDEHVHELVESAVVVEQAVGETGVLRIEPGDHVGERARLDLDQLVAARHRTQGGGDSNGDSHSEKR